jgi:hypothetical protein
MAHPLAKGLVGCWLLNENAGTRALDLSPYQNHLTLIGFDTPPRRSFNGLAFNGSSTYAKESIADWRSADSQGTIIVWFYLSTLGVASQFFASADEASTTRYLNVRATSANKFVLAQRNADTADSVAGSSTLVARRWYQGIVDSDGSIWAMYLDLKPETLTVTNVNSGDWFADTTGRDNVAIGALVQSTITNYCAGMVGQILVYNRLLLQTEKTANYLSPYSPFGIPMFI